MTPYLHDLILTYGYWLMAFGALIEGETFLIAGGIAAQQGILDPVILILFALFGSMIHDFAFFFIGRFFGQNYLDKKPQFHAKADAVLDLLDKYGVWLIIGLRYAYGLRTIIPTALGLSHISSQRFIFFDLIGGILWSCTFVLGGYFLGKAFEQFLHTLTHYENMIWAFLSIAVIVVVIASGAWLWIRQKRKKP